MHTTVLGICVLVLRQRAVLLPLLNDDTKVGGKDFQSSTKMGVGVGHSASNGKRLFDPQLWKQILKNRILVKFRQVTFLVVLPLPGAVSMVLAAIVAPQGPRTSWAHLEQQARLPLSFNAAGRFHRGGGLSFSLCSRSPWRARQKPLIAGIACNGAALHVFCVVSHVTPQRQTPGGLPSRRASFFQGVSPCAKMIAGSGKKSGKNSTQGKTSSDGQPPSSCSWSSVCLAASTITPPNRPCARPPSSASRGGVHVLQQLPLVRAVDRALPQAPRRTLLGRDPG